jgi:hypothetical protein
MAGEIFTIAGICISLTLVGLLLGYGILQVVNRAE